MGKVSRIGVAVIAALLVGGWPNATGTEFARFNLDLPFNAGGVDEEDEEAPEIVYLYGSTYEANAVVFCLDESLTMRRESRFDIQRREATRAVMELSDRTEFGIVFYGAGVIPYRERLQPANAASKAGATAFIASRTVNLGTCTGDAVVKSLRMLQRSSLSHKTVIVVSDGQPTDCPFKPIGGCENQRRINQRILAQIKSANATAIRIHTIFVGQSDICNDGLNFMRTMASSNGGTFRKVTQ